MNGSLEPHEKMLLIRLLTIVNLLVINPDGDRIGDFCTLLVVFFAACFFLNLHLASAVRELMRA